MKILLLIPLLVVGCSTFHTRQVEIGKDGIEKSTEVTIRSFFDSNSDISKLRTTHTTQSQGISVGSVSENVSSTNLAAILGAISEGAVRGLK